MATDAQNEANRKNATSSTGPQSPEGKSTSSRNAVSHGLFSARDTLHPNQQNEFTDLAAALQKDLAPEGPLEQTLAREITRAAWRLRRCANIEDSLTEVDPLTDPMASEATIGTQNAVDRARLQTHRILSRSITELRRLQNERQFRLEILPAETDTSKLGLTSYKELIAPMVAEKRWQLQKRQLEGATPPTKTTPHPEKTKQTQSAPVAGLTSGLTSVLTSGVHAAIPANPFTPRNAPCPCGSGQKHKRCCGKQAPPVLHYAAA